MKSKHENVRGEGSKRQVYWPLFLLVLPIAGLSSAESGLAKSRQVEGESCRAC